MTSAVEVNCTAKDFEIFKSQLDEKVQDGLCIWLPGEITAFLRTVKVGSFQFLSYHLQDFIHPFGWFTGCVFPV